MSDQCIKRRLLFACRQTYRDELPLVATAAKREVPGLENVGWAAPPHRITGGPNKIDRVLVGRVKEGIVVAFRGTMAPFGDNPQDGVIRDWLNNARFLSQLDPTYPGRVHAGFARSLNALWPKLEERIGKLLALDGPKALFITGHSKGGALANLAAWRALGIKGFKPPIRVFTIAAARAGNEDFRTAVRLHGAIQCLRYEAPRDVVPLLPLGADTPPWAKPVIQALWPGARNNNYVPMGTRMPADSGGLGSVDALKGLFDKVELDFHGLNLGALKANHLKVLAAAHSIDPGTSYDSLICRGEGGCDHA